MTQFALQSDKAPADYKANGNLVGVFLKGPGRGSAERGDKPAYPNHVGLLFVDPTGATREFHFIDDNKIINEVLKPTKPVFHAPIGFDEMNALAFASFLSALVAKGKLPNIKYGLDWGAVLGSFDEDGNYRFDGKEGDPGMTCASFVSELISNRGLRLVDFSQWPENEQRDLEWRRAKLDTLRDKPGYTPERIAAMEGINPFVRIHPAEAAAVAAENSDLWETLIHRRVPAPEGQPDDPQKTIEELAAEVVQAFAETLP